LKGRLTGTPEIELAAEYIASQFEQFGLQPAGELDDSGDTYYQSIPYNLRDHTAPTKLVLRDRYGEVLADLEYRRDYAEYPWTATAGGVVTAEVVYVAQSLESIRWNQCALDAHRDVWEGKIQIGLSTRVFDYWGFFRGNQTAGLLISDPGDSSFSKYTLPTASRSAGGQHLSNTYWEVPVLAITEELADRMLAEAGETAASLRNREEELRGDRCIVLPTGITAEIEVNTAVRERVEVRNVLGFMPGTDSQMDEEAVLVVAHYDGLGTDAGGNLYPGANDNASGVGAMLEIMRLWKEQGYRPKRTVFFVAWAGAARGQLADIERFMRAHLGFIGAYKITAAVELTGVGGGSGESLLLKRSTSGRLTELFQEAGRRTGVSMDTRGRGVHDEWDTRQPDMRIPRIVLTWSGSGDAAHTAEDTTEAVDLGKLRQAGRTAALGLMVLGREKGF